MSDFRKFGRIALLLSILLAGGAACQAQSPSIAPTASTAAPSQGWPRVFQDGGETVTMYQPQIEQWDDTTMTFRAAVAIEPAGGGEPIYGMVRTTAQADVDKAARVVTLHDFQVIKVTFPTASEREAWYAAMLTQRLPTHAKQVSLDRLEASAAVSLAVKKQRGLGLNNDPPRIVFSTTPALLVLVDGDPVLRPFGGAERVINTHALIVKAGGVFYTTSLNFWYEAPAITGPWKPLAEPPASLAQLRQAAGDEVDLMQPETSAAPLAAPPALFVSTVPAELIQTDGTPEFVEIADTTLFQAQNSDDAIFLDGQTREYFVLISGRWFKSASLERGPWLFVSARDLPPDFARIPSNNPRANALASVAGTPEAQEALIANAIPQTATVTPGPADVNVLYDGAADGAPQFEPIEGVPDLQYAENASLPVIESAPDAFYCVQNGIWCVAPTCAGPWVVASAVPADIYSIPPSCPVHYVTYCRIYSFTPQAVCVGYTPGYLGTVVSADGVVVFGTGYHYRPHIGRVWIGQPCTYGFGAGFACGSDTGFAFGFAEGIFAGGCLAPYWGPYDWGWRHHFNYSHISVNHVDLYEHWSGKVASIPQRPGHGNEREDSRLHPQATFNPYSARPTALSHNPSVMPAEHEPAAKSAKLDWSANAKSRQQSLGWPSETTAAKQPAPASKPNNIFVSATGEVWRSTPAPATKSNNLIVKVTGPDNPAKRTPAPPAESEPAEGRQASERAPAAYETPAQTREPAQTFQWEQHADSGWHPAAQSPAFQAAAPELNREAAARSIGETRAVSQPPRFAEQPSRLMITPSAQSTPMPGGGQRR